MKITIELTENEIRNYIAQQLNQSYGLTLTAEDLPIEVKSKQNYKSEWETAYIRVKVDLVR